MQAILKNLAALDLLNFCKTHNIDPGGKYGSYVVKYPRKQTYALVQYETKKTLATVTFHKNQVPTHTK